MSELAEALVRFEPWLRLSAFLGIFAILATWEAMAPRRVRAQLRRDRWFANIGISALNSLAVRALSLLAAVAAAVFAERNGIGILHSVEAPLWMNVAISFVVLDLLVFGQHFALHHVPILWRLHRIHHADPDVDVSTGIRFHPVEIVLSQFLKAAVVLLLGALPVSVILFEIVLNATTLFNHSNLKLSPRMDRIVRAVTVTPDMHRVHHSIRREEHDSNFGFNLSLWDRLFGTYRAQPMDGHETMTLGLSAYPGRTAIGLWWLLSNPFAGEVKSEPRGA